MDLTIQKALEHLANANYAGYFEEMDKVAMPKQWQAPYANHKGVFIAGQAPWNFYQQLDTLAHEILKELEKIQGKLDELKSPSKTSDFKEQALTMLEEGCAEEALKIIIPNTRGTKMHPTVIAINTSFKEYEKDKLAGKDVRGQLQDIISRITELLEKL
jgi:hypothetical protein